MSQTPTPLLGVGVRRTPPPTPVPFPEVPGAKWSAVCRHRGNELLFADIADKKEEYTNNNDWQKNPTLSPLKNPHVPLCNGPPSEPRPPAEGPYMGEGHIRISPHNQMCLSIRPRDPTYKGGHQREGFTPSPRLLEVVLVFFPSPSHLCFDVPKSEGYPIPPLGGRGAVQPSR